jgi:hypothetical protein
VIRDGERKKKEERKREKGRTMMEKGLIYKFLLEVKREKKQNVAESGIQL